ncbi:MAG: hypothetical protein KF874_02295 [Rhizobiaceae bacterium]|nr:hypothetical protein [Rhizobiaceae bacterium]
MTTLHDLSPAFRHVRLLLARSPEQPEGNRNEGYDLLVPLQSDGKLDAAEWKKHQQHCRVRYFKQGEQDRVGKLRRKPGGEWYFDYAEGTEDDEPGFRLGDEQFMLGEYVGIAHEGQMQTYQVARVERP